MSNEFNNDQELVKSLQAGDHKAFKVIFNKYWERLYGIAYNRLQSKETSKELIQDLFTELWEKRERIIVYKSLASYLFSALKYKILNHIAAQAVRRRYKEEAGHTIKAFSNITEEQLSFDELYVIMEKEIDKLPKKCKLVFLMNRDGESAKQIARKLDISPRTAEAHINNARKILKTKLPGYSPLIIALLYM